MSRPVITLIPVAALLFAVAGCTSDDPPPPDSGNGTASAAPSASAAPPPAGRTFVAGDATLTAAMTPLIRTGSTVVLSLRTTVTALPGVRRSEGLATHFSRSLTSSFDGPKLIDPAAGRVYEVARTQPDAGDCTCTGSFPVDLGQSTLLQAAFTGVPADATTMTVSVPYAGIFRDVPIQDGTVPTPPPAILNGSPVPAIDWSQPGTSTVRDLVEHRTSLVAPVNTRKTTKQTDVDLSADVLFRVDKSDLTPAANKSINAALADLEAAGPGPLTITGHTDDTGTTAHNQTLSEARARTVANALRARLPDAQWPKTVSGKGETQPLVPNTNATNRQINRRVTVSYPPRTTTGTSTPSPSTPATAAPLPATTGVVGTASAGVDVNLAHQNDPQAHPAHISAGPATRIGDYVLIDLTVRIGDVDSDISSFLREPFNVPLNEFTTRDPYDDSGVHMLDGTSINYPVGYQISETSRSCLCDPDLAEKMAANSVRTLPIWYPAPPPGTTTVTLDAVGKFRLTDVPVG
jgi:OmpA-OmpF porin, OOP family